MTRMNSRGGRPRCGESPLWRIEIHSAPAVPSLVATAIRLTLDLVHFRVLSCHCLQISCISIDDLGQAHMTPDAILAWSRSLSPSLQPTRKRRRDSFNMSDQIDTPTKRRMGDPHTTPTQDTIARDQNLALEHPLPAFVAPNVALSASPSLSSSASNATSSTVDSSRKRRRKDVSVPSLHFSLQALRQLVRVQPLDDLEELSHESKALWTSMRACSKGRGIIPSNHQADLLELLEGGADFEDDCVRPPTDIPDSSLCPKFDDVQTIVETARRNTTRNRSEPAWNSSVHYQVLDLARKCSRFSRMVTVENITTAVIVPDNLLTLPADNGLGFPSGTTLPTNRVDFAYAWDTWSDQPLDTFLRVHNLCDINQTYYPPLSICPILTSIETKRPGSSWLEALDQLSSWTYAGKVKARQVGQDLGLSPSKFPPRPQIIVQGHEWYFVVIEDRIDHDVLWNKVLFGTTETNFGTYKLVAGLQIIIDYTCNTYLPWYKRMVLGCTPTLPQRPTNDGPNAEQ
ncbi:hypothetical protein KVT40_009250 [Elsinoe batatas]|uniref:PD-(D/E)XK nuclease-like domain-containing protein n=1 Tax=Elsinoe batatas TaxID=2601811 RepID=A0A8K0PDC5_9PEZI|nr:hypothetical protein KVT40_009250 [Elsinoe batatas]